MKRIRIIWLIAIFGLGILGCKKDSLDTSPNGTYQDEYRFYAKAKVNGLPIDFNAGEGNYGMETDYSIEDSVVVMTGTLAKVNEPMKNAVLLRIRSEQVVAGKNDFQVEKSLVPGLYSYRDMSGYCALPGSYDLDFFGDSTLSPLTYLWTFQDGSLAYQQNPNTQRVQVGDYDPFKVSMKTDYLGCESKVTHWVNIEKNCEATFELSDISPKGFIVNTIARKGNVLSVDWSLDGQEVAPDFVGRISASLYGEHTLRAEMYFEEGCTKVVERTFDVASGMPCLTDFGFEKRKATEYDARQLGAIELEYYDENGKRFSTFYHNTIGDFKIISLSPYLENEKGQSTTRFFFEADAILKSEDGTSVELTECFGSFAVAHP